MDQKTVVELKNIRKEFPGVVALDQVNLQLKSASVHALVGENGAGKSTLMKILSGTYTSYEGTVLVNGQEVHMKSERDAFEHGISIVSQELNFVPEMTIAENLFLGREPLKNGCFLNKKERSAKADELIRMIGLSFDPEMKMGDLSVASRQMVEILKAISRGSHVIIMDEPTSALTNKETEIFFQKVRELKAQGIAFVFISHRLEEVFALCDEYTVLRDGKWIGSGRLQDVNAEKLISLMVGRDIQEIYPAVEPYRDRVVLEVEGLTGEAFEDVSFSIREGEILGFAGMMGAGRSEIARAVFGMDKPLAGTIRIDGKVCHFRSAQDAISAGVAMATEDRASYGFVGVRSIRENIMLPNGDLFTRSGFWQKAKINEAVAKICRNLAVKAPDVETLVGNLSGGNQQKVVLAKWLVRNVKVLILDEPTRGIDVGAKQEIYKLITELARQGMAILLISSDMPEVLSMSHSVAVIAQGRKIGVLRSGEATQDKIMKMIVEADK